MASDAAAAAATAPRVRADPLAELPVKNYKYVQSCTELHLAQRGIAELAHFDGFANLEALWLNGNRIERLEGLDACFRLKELHAQDNRVRSLAGSSLGAFKFLQTLRLSGNKLRDLRGTLAVLARLHHLQDLDLYDNPIEEEDNYRLHVVRAVPSLLVLDRHVVSDDERARAARLRVAVDDGGGQKLNAKNTTKPKQVAGAPPPSMPGTVKLLFREVEQNAREREAARRAAVASERLLVQEQQRQLVRSPPANASATPDSEAAAARCCGGLDAWELSALEKRFRALEDTPKSGVALEAFGRLAAHLADRGFCMLLANGDRVLASDQDEETGDDGSAALRSLFAQPPVAWARVRQALEKRQLRCEPMAAPQLRRRADECFAQAAALQRRLAGVSSSSSSSSRSSSDDVATQKLTAESLELAQRAYHLASLADAASARQPTKPPPRKEPLSPLRTRYYATTFARDANETAAFHELKEQSGRVGDAGAKYKLQQKDFQKYMVKQAPPATTLVRRQFHL